MGSVLEPRFQPQLISRTTNYRDAHRGGLGHSLGGFRSFGRFRLAPGLVVRAGPGAGQTFQSLGKG